MDIEHLKKYKNLEVSLEESRTIARLEIDELGGTDKKNLEKLILLGDGIVDKMIEENAKRIFLISKYGLDSFVSAAKLVVSKNNITDVLCIMDSVMDYLEHLENDRDQKINEILK